MKKSIIAVLIVLWFSVAFGEDDFRVGDATISYFEFEEIIPAETNPLSISNKQEVIQYFIDSGDVCKIVGHVWRNVHSMVTLGIMCYDDNGQPTSCPQDRIRKCRICGKEKREVTKWIDIE